MSYCLLGGGGRLVQACMQLGVYVVELALANLLHSFNWTLPDGTKLSELDMGDAFRLSVPKAVNLIAVLSLRINCPVV